MPSPKGDEGLGGGLHIFGANFRENGLELMVWRLWDQSSAGSVERTRGPGGGWAGEDQGGRGQELNGGGVGVETCLLGGVGIIVIVIAAGGLVRGGVGDAEGCREGEEDGEDGEGIDG